MRAATPVRGAVPPRDPGLRDAATFAHLLQALAGFQALFFMLPVASPRSRLVGIALALSTMLASRILRPLPARRMLAIVFLAAMICVNFAFHLYAASPNFPFRIWQIAVLVGYVIAGFAGLASVFNPSWFRPSLYGSGIAGVALLLAETLVGGPGDFRLSAGKVEWTGATVQDSVLGARFLPNTVVKTFYPDNPRGYFDEPDALQRRWTLQEQEGSKAQLAFPADRRGVLRVAISEVPGKVRWHISLAQSPIRIQAEERYELRFRARADSVRTVIVGVGQAHAPWAILGLFRELRVDTTWRDFTQTFRATESDRLSRLFFEFGEERPSVELSNVSLRAISTNTVVQAPARRELSVTYRINGHGCRGADYPERDSAPVWRILSLGNADTFGVGVHQNDTYTARLESLLRVSGAAGERSAPRFDAINCGVPGISMSQQRRLLDSLSKVYSPDVVLLALAPTDDRASAADEQPAASPARAGIKNLFRSWSALSALRRPEPVAPDYAKIVEDVRQIDSATRAQGRRLALVLFQHRRRPEWLSLDSALAVGLRGAKIPVLKLGPVLLPFGEDKLLVHSVFDWHPNELAHRISAEALRKFLADEGLLGTAVRIDAAATDTSRGRQ